jgi:CRISPR-associated protein Cas1
MIVMKYLLLSGHGIKMNVDSGKLHVQDGRNSVDVNPNSYVFQPKRMDYDNIVVYGHTGNITFEAMRWLVKQNIQLTLLDWNGRMLTNILPLEAKQTKLKFAQYKAYQNSERIYITKELLDAKFKGHKAVLKWLKEKYPQVRDDTNRKASQLPKFKTVKDIMLLESRVSSVYWKELAKIFDKKFEFENRDIGKTTRPFGAVDPINALFNYGYALLESQCFRAINSVGLDTHVGFLHEVIAGKTPLVYDLQEPFRWLIDVAILNGLENKVFDKKDFIRTENYNIRLRPSGASKLTKEIEKQMSKKVEYLGSYYSWYYIIMLKAQELAQYLIGKRKTIDFSVPKAELIRKDDYALRQKILKLSQVKAKKIGIGKSELHYLRRKAKSGKQFKIYCKVKKRL